jgi:hypothetical protein
LYKKIDDLSDIPKKLRKKGLMWLING